MLRNYLRIGSGLLLLGSLVYILSSTRRLALTHVVYDFHGKISVGTSEQHPSVSGWHEESDSPFQLGSEVLPGSSNSPDEDAQPSSPPQSAASISSSRHGQQNDFRYSHLGGLCRNTPWNPNLTLHCHSGCGPDQLSLCGGLAEARNRVQTCLRLAIDAGASGGLIIPPVMARAEDDFMLGLGSGSVCPGDLWDIADLQRTLGNWCPELEVRTTAACGNENGNDSTSDKAVMETGQNQHVKTLNLPTRSYRGPHHSIATSSSSSSSTLSFGRLVREFLHSASLDAEPVVVRYGDPYLAWDYARSSETATLRRELFHAVRYNASLLALGRAVSEQIAEAAGEGALGRFIGVHLPGEGDLPEMGSGGAEAQMRGFVKAIKEIASSSATSSRPMAGASPGDMKKRNVDDSQIRTVYVSCSDRATTQRLREMLEPLNYTVYDWRTLLDPHLRAGSNFDDQHHPGNDTLVTQIEALGSDQRDVVEYEALVRGRYWIGISASPLSTLIAYARGSGGGGGAIENDGGEKGPGKETGDWLDKFIHPQSSKTVGADGGGERGEQSAPRLTSTPSPPFRACVAGIVVDPAQQLLLAPSLRCGLHGALQARAALEIGTSASDASYHIPVGVPSPKGQLSGSSSTASTCSAASRTRAAWTAATTKEGIRLMSPSRGFGDYLKLDQLAQLAPETPPDLGRDLHASTRRGCSNATQFGPGGVFKCG
ncbi:hypothetical protein PG993_002325 [Apiospora rasikravindrae]|uniref:O-fucosyltransferase family protein n=1 Tax=Apiospora rasikravindrae TaxID=990691 RepID=A0ABR1TWA9_9PEZI